MFEQDKSLPWRLAQRGRENKCVGGRGGDEISEVGSTQRSAMHLAIGKGSPDERLGQRKLFAGRSGATQIGLCLDRLVHRRFGQVCIDEVGVAQIGTPKESLAEICSTEVGAAKIRTAQLAYWRLIPAKSRCAALYRPINSLRSTWTSSCLRCASTAPYHCRARGSSVAASRRCRPRGNSVYRRACFFLPSRRIRAT